MGQTCASAFIVWANPREIIEYEHDVHGEIVVNDDGSKKILSSTPSFLALLSEQEICDLVLKMWVDSKPGRIGAVTYCVSETGFHHLHMVLEVENADSDRFTYKQVQKLYGRKFHIEPTRGRKSDAEDYIYKRGRFAESGEKVLAMAMHGNIRGNQGARHDLQAMDDMLKNGMTPQQILDEVGLSAYRYSGMLQSAYVRQKEVEVGSYRPVKVVYHVGSSWTGKSHTRLELEEEYGKENLYFVSAAAYKRGPWDHYSGQKVIFLDELRADSLTYAELLAVLNNYVGDIDARYSNKKMLWNEVHITTILPPEILYREMSFSINKKYDTFDQLKNRIDLIVYHWKDGDEFKKYEMQMKDYEDYKMLEGIAKGKLNKQGFYQCTDEEAAYVQQYLM